MPLLACTDEHDCEGNAVIVSLRGIVIDKSLDTVVIECAGVGYECSATPGTIAALPRGEEVFVLTAHVVREDSQSLFAFSDATQRQAFLVIQTVSGVGARLALGVLSALSPAELARAVGAGDVKALQQAPGVGKRLAQRMAVDLKGKLAGLGAAEQALGSRQGAAAPESSYAGENAGDDYEQVRESVLEALVGLGFSRGDGEKVLAEVLASWKPEQPLAVATVLKLSLSAMNGGR